MSSVGEVGAGSTVPVERLLAGVVGVAAVWPRVDDGVVVAAVAHGPRGVEGRSAGGVPGLVEGRP